MAAAIALRSDFTGADLRRLARRAQDARQARRLLALLTIYDGGSRSEAANGGDVGLQIIRDWVPAVQRGGAAWHDRPQGAGPEPLPPKCSEPGRDHLAIHAGQLAVEPRLSLLHQHPRSLL